MQVRTENRMVRCLFGFMFVFALLLCAGQAGCEKEPDALQTKSRQTGESVVAVDSNDLVIEGAADQNEVSDEPNWPKPRFVEEADRRRRMVDHIRRAYDFDDETVLDAMMCVPRHKFTAGHSAMMSYADTPLPIGYNQTISQPYIVAVMTSILDLGPGKKVLEIGTGSGYQAAVLAELTPHVYTIEIVEELGKRGQEKLARLGYTTIKIRIGDGYKGWPEEQPFDAIIVTCGPEKIRGPLIEQLKVGGRMIIPVGRAGIQELVLITKNDDGSLTRKNVLPVRFVPMTGEVQRGR